jgi:hypothetical protein
VISAAMPPINAHQRPTLNARLFAEARFERGDVAFQFEAQGLRVRPRRQG